MTSTIHEMTQARPARWALLSSVTMTALIGYVGLVLYAMAVMAGRLDWRGIAFAVATLLLAGLIAGGRRWAAPLAAILSALLLIEMLPIWSYALAHASSKHALIFHSLFLAAGTIGLTAGIGATMHNYGKLGRGAARRLLLALALLVGTGVAAILLTIPWRDTASPDQAATATGPTLTTANFAFDRIEIRAPSGETVELRLQNRDPFAHSFDVDAWDVHQPMLTGEIQVVRFTPTEPGTYTFYCGVPGHRQSGMLGTLIVER